MKNKFIHSVGISFLVVCLLAVNSLAFGVSSSYWDGNPLKMYPGESKKILLNLQNNVGAEETVAVSAALVSGEEIASLEENEYSVPFGENVNVPVEISVPLSASVGSAYPIKVSFTTITSDNGGVGLGLAFDTVFEVTIVEKSTIPEEPQTRSNYLVWILLVIAILIVFYFLLWKKKNKEEKNNK